MAKMLEMVSINLKRFLWDKGNRLLAADASNLGPACEGNWWLRRIYPDACDVGIRIFSAKTGKSMTFYLEREERDAEGDLVAWHFRPVPESRRECNVDEVVIFND